jgi:hypothetical protein
MCSLSPASIIGMDPVSIARLLYCAVIFKYTLLFDNCTLHATQFWEKDCHNILAIGSGWSL